MVDRERLMNPRRDTNGLVLGLVLWVLAGCVSREPVRLLEIRTLPPAIQAAAEQGRLRVAVVPFTDARPAGSRLGSRVPLFGDTTYFNLQGGAVGDVVAEMIAEYLRQEKGWRTWLAKPGVKPPEGGPAVTLSGRVLAFEAQARSWFMVTNIEVRTELEVEAVVEADKEPIRLILEETDSQWTLGFAPRDVESSLNQALLRSFGKLVRDTGVVEQKLSHGRDRRATVEPSRPIAPDHPETPPP